MKDAVRHLDKRFEALRPLLAVPRPQKGWVRAIRNALGMTAKQLADRIGVEQPRITEIEKAEVSGNITLVSLERAAEALGCRFVYAFVPKSSLSEIITKQANSLIDEKMAVVQQTMNLEDQSVDNSEAIENMRLGLMDDLIQKPARLWDKRKAPQK